MKLTDNRTLLFLHANVIDSPHVPLFSIPRVYVDFAGKHAFTVKYVATLHFCIGIWMFRLLSACNFAIVSFHNLEYRVAHYKKMLRNET